MNKLLMLVAAGVAVASAGSADASGGCGRSFHRGPRGGCRPNRERVELAPGAPVIGVFYAGHGYWDGYRYRERREHWHGGWRYR